MRIDNPVSALVGTLVLVSVALSWLVTPYALLLVALVGINLLRVSIAGNCPPAAQVGRFALMRDCASNLPGLSQQSCTLGSGLSDLWGVGRW